MRRTGLASLGLVLAAGAASAQEVACGEPYAIQRGDTLQEIAERAYGPEGSFRTLWDANRERLGWINPSLIEVGEVLVIPCLDASAAPIAEPAPSEAAEEAIEPAAEPEPPAPLRIAVLAAGGPAEAAAVAAIVEAALARSEGDEVRVELVQDAAARPLDLAESGYVLSLPWPDPGCGTGGGAAPPEACEALNWSEPLYERVVAVYRRPTFDEAERGAPRLCQPEALEALGVYPNAQPILEGDAETCFAALAEARVDLVAAASGAAARALAALPPEAAPREVFDMARTVPLAAVGRSGDAASVALLRRLDAGLAALRDDGTWFETVRTALAEAERPAR